MVIYGITVIKCFLSVFYQYIQNCSCKTIDSYTYKSKRESGEQERKILGQENLWQDPAMRYLVLYVGLRLFWIQNTHNC